MPWRETSPMDQRTQFIADYLRRSLSMTELCTHYGISRKSGYKGVDRYLHDGPRGLEDLSRKPYTAPNRTPEHVVKALVDVRTHHPTWGAKKLLAAVERAGGHALQVVADIALRKAQQPRHLGLAAALLGQNLDRHADLRIDSGHDPLPNGNEPRPEAGQPANLCVALTQAIPVALHGINRTV